MKLLKKFLLTFAIAITAITISSCKQNIEPGIYNSWQDNNGIILTFTKNTATMTMQYETLTMSLRGDCTINRNKIVINFDSVILNGEEQSGTPKDLLGVAASAIPEITDLFKFNEDGSITLTYIASIKNNILTLSDPNDSSSKTTYTLYVPASGNEK